MSDQEVPPDITPPSVVAASDLKKSPPDPPIAFCAVIVICAEAFAYSMQIRNREQISFSFIVFVFMMKKWVVLFFMYGQMLKIDYLNTTSFIVAK